jgi:hypothetical protein
MANKRLQILAAVTNTINGISVANGYNKDYTTSHMKVHGWEGSRAQRPLIMWAPGDTEFDPQTAGCRHSRLTVAVICHFDRPDPDSADEGSLILKDIARAFYRSANIAGGDLRGAGLTLLTPVAAGTDDYVADGYAKGTAFFEAILEYQENASDQSEA